MTHLEPYEGLSSKAGRELGALSVMIKDKVAWLYRFSGSLRTRDISTRSVRAETPTSRYEMLGSPLFRLHPCVNLQMVFPLSWESEPLLGKEQGLLYWQLFSPWEMHRSC